MLRGDVTWRPPDRPAQCPGAMHAQRRDQMKLCPRLGQDPRALLFRQRHIGLVNRARAPDGRRCGGAPSPGRSRPRLPPSVVVASSFCSAATSMGSGDSLNMDQPPATGGMKQPFPGHRQSRSGVDAGTKSPVHRGPHARPRERKAVPRVRKLPRKGRPGRRGGGGRQTCSSANLRCSRSIAKYWTAARSWSRPAR